MVSKGKRQLLECSNEMSARLCRTGKCAVISLLHSKRMLHQICGTTVPFDLRCESVTYEICILIGSFDLRCGPRASDIHIRQFPMPMLQVICITSMHYLCVGKRQAAQAPCTSLLNSLYRQTCEGSIVGFELVSRNMCYKCYQKLALRNRECNKYSTIVVPGGMEIFNSVSV